MKVALITGITGQDGAYLAEFLLNKGYEVHGLKRRSSLFNTARIDHLYHDQHEKGLMFKLHYCDLTDSTNLVRIIEDIKPDEIYNLAAQSHVKISFETPEYTSNTDGIGTLRVLEAIRILGFGKKTKIYQASTSELFGMVQEAPQNESTPFYPRSPYAVAKLYAHWIIINYREAYGFFACNGILFNHESPLRGETFVTRKITRAATKIVMGLQSHLFIGNLSAERDWGHAKDYVEAMWLMLQQQNPEDFVIATGVSISVREFIKMTFLQLGIEIEFSGKNENERGVIIDIDEQRVFELGLKRDNLRFGQTIIKVDPRYFRPTEVDFLIGDASKAKCKLGWDPKYSLVQMINEMVSADLILAKKEEFLKTNGFYSLNQFE